MSAARILVADDEDFIALLIAELLLDHEYEVQIVYNGRDAIEAVCEQPPDLVITDIMMPHATGIELLTRMREHEKTRNTPVILMSAAVSPSVRDEKVRFIPKPFNIQAVLDTVTQSLGGSKQQHQPA